MKYLDFSKAFHSHPAFTVQDIQLLDPHFHRNQLTYWQQQGYLQKLRRGVYRLLKGPPPSEAELYWIANRLYPHSYLSCELALSIYNVIPEAVFTLTSISSLKTMTFQTPLGEFRYQHLKKNLMFGVKLITIGMVSYRIGELEKVILDYLYLRSNIKKIDDFQELRWNCFTLREQLSMEKLDLYLTEFQCKKLSQSIIILKKYLEE